MAAKKKKVATKKTPVRTPVASGGEMPAAAKAVAPPPPPSTDPKIQAKREALDAIANKYNKDGHMVIVRACDAPNTYALRRPTGIMELDIDLGGGWPAGGLCFVSGKDNTGKTWLLLQTMAMHQRIYGDAASQVLAITEGAMDYKHAYRMGLRITLPDEVLRDWNTARTQRGLEAYSEADVAWFKYQIGEFRIIRGDTGEEICSVLLDIVRARACHIIGLDSIQGLRPAADADKEMDERAMRAAQASMFGEFLKRYIPNTTGLNGINETTLLMTQQMRANPNKATAPAHIQQYLPDSVTTGAYATRHYKLIDVELREGKKISKGEGSEKRIVGKTVQWNTEKGKAGTHDNIRGEVNFSYESPPAGVDFPLTVIEAATARGILRVVKGKVQMVRAGTDTILPEYSAPSLKAFKRCMEEDVDFELAVRREVLAAAGIECLYR